LTQADVRAGAALAAYKNYDYAAAEREARFAYDGLAAAAAQINVHLAPAAYQAVRRNPADFNQAMRDWIRFITGTGDSVAAMTGTVSSAGVRGLEVNPLLPIATTKLTDKLTRGAHATLR
jgi:ADP-ribosylglycohydrolase